MQKTIDRDHNGTHNRTLTMEWLMENEMIVANTTKTKPLDKLITFRDKKRDNEYRNWKDKNIFAQLDLITIKRRWRNAIKNIESDSSGLFPSDHFPLNAEIQVKLANKEESQTIEKPPIWKSVQKTIH